MFPFSKKIYFPRHFQVMKGILYLAKIMSIADVITLLSGIFAIIVI